MYAAKLIHLAFPQALISNGADIADYIYRNPSALQLSLKGFWISDRKQFCDSVVSGIQSQPTCSLHWLGRHTGRIARCQLRQQV